MAGSKCWFVLQHAHYPPPILPANGVGRATGPLCLGHLIPNLQKLDHVINRSGPLDFPPDMPVYQTRTRDLDYQSIQENRMNISVEAGISILRPTGNTSNASDIFAFQRTVSNCSRFKSLDTYIVQVTPSYIEDSLETHEVMSYVKRPSGLGSRSVFMITGIMVARGGRISTSDRVGRELAVEPGISAPGVAKAGLDLGTTSQGKTAMTSDQETDFVWAIRLAKVSKGILDKEWTHATFSKGATFDLNLDNRKNLAAEAAAALGREGVKGAEVVCGEADVYVIGTVQDQGS